MSFLLRVTVITEIWIYTRFHRYEELHKRDRSLFQFHFQKNNKQILGLLFSPEQLQSLMNPYLGAIFPRKCRRLEIAEPRCADGWIRKLRGWIPEARAEWNGGFAGPPGATLHHLPRIPGMSPGRHLPSSGSTGRAPSSTPPGEETRRNLRTYRNTTYNKQKLEHTLPFTVCWYKKKRRVSFFQ